MDVMGKQIQAAIDAAKTATDAADNATAAASHQPTISSAGTWLVWDAEHGEYVDTGVDTQDDRLEYEVVGWGHYGENWGIKKGVIMGALKVQEAGPKYCHFPRGDGRGYDLAFFNGLLSEKLVMKSERGRTRWAWEKLPGHERNEALDCRNYALAALRVLDPDMDAVAARLREPTVNIKSESPTSRARRKVKRRETGDDW